MKYIIFTIVFLAPSIAYSQDYITIKKGEVVPYDGFLMTQNSLSVMISKCQGIKMKCEKDIQYEKDNCLIQMSKIEEKAKINLDAANIRYDKMISIKDEEIKKLKGTYKYKSMYGFWDKPLWVGIAVGAIITSATLFGVHYIIER